MKTESIRKGRMLEKLAIVVVTALWALNAHAWPCNVTFNAK